MYMYILEIEKFPFKKNSWQWYCELRAAMQIRILSVYPISLDGTTSGLVYSSSDHTSRSFSQDFLPITAGHEPERGKGRA